jgi:hypothetical protein
MADSPGRKPKRISLGQAIIAAREQGITLTRTEIHPDGRIVLFHTEADPVSASPFDAWKAKCDARNLRASTRSGRNWPRASGSPITMPGGAGPG